MAKIDDLIALYEQRLERLKGLRELLSDDPSFAAEVFGSTCQGNTLQRLPGQRRRKKTQFDKVIEVLADGQWRTMKEIADSIRAKKASIAPHFYRQAELFESRKHPRNSRTNQWRLKPRLEDAE